MNHKLFPRMCFCSQTSVLTIRQYSEGRITLLVSLVSPAPAQAALLSSRDLDRRLDRQEKTPEWGWKETSPNFPGLFQQLN